MSESRVDDEITLLFFNTHGESLARRCSVDNGGQAEFHHDTFVRARAAEIGVPLYHQSSFQGGDGYRLFGTPAFAQATISGIFACRSGACLASLAGRSILLSNRLFVGFIPLFKKLA